MATTAETFQVAFTHHQAGELRQAEALYRQVLQVEPRHFDALHLLGLVAYQVGRHDAAVELIAQAIGMRGDRAIFHSNLGEAYRALGKLNEAENCFRQALRLDENLPDAHNNLGNVLRARGQSAEAMAAFEEAIRLRPAYAEAHNNLGTVLQAQGDLAGAMANYRQAIALNPRYAEAYNNLGTAWRTQGDLTAARECYEQALQQAPRHRDAHLNLGTVYQAQKQLGPAMACYREALRLDPGFALAHNNLGTALKESNRLEEAIASFREALRLQSDCVDAHFNLGAALHVQKNWTAAAETYGEALRLQPDHAPALASLATLRQHQGRLDEAMELFERALQIDPKSAITHLKRANLHKLKKMVPEAIAGYETALRLQPNNPEAYNNLAVLLNDIAQPDAAIECCRKGLEQEPASAALYDNLATALQNLGRLDEAIACSRKSVELRPETAEGHTNLLYRLNLHPDYDPPTIFAEHLAWARRHAEPLTALAEPHPNDRTPDRRLRIGYVSPYFRDHAVNFFSEPMIAAHDHRQFEIFCYSDVRIPDQVTSRLLPAADHWRDVFDQSDERLARTVRDDRIDILVDLTGHIAGNRLLTFARKPAPIQVTYLGYQNTTGMSAMDYRLTDERADPSGMTDAYYTERLVRLPRCFFCYRPPDEAPPIAPLPALEAGHVTFGSFNNFSKVGPRVIDAWLTILTRVPHSRLLVLAHRGGYLQRHFDELAQARGIDPARIELCDKRPRTEYLGLLQQADIGLDPFPFNGHTTTCDSIWMGLPVVMLQGQCYASRFGGSALAQVGLEDLIADSAEHYVDRAVALAGDLDRLARLRVELRPRMAESGLLDFAGFSRNLEQAYRQMWLAWLGSDAAGAIR
jgi:protein O-GlcNAc transferase